MNIVEQVGKVVEKLTGDSAKMEQFKTDPVKAVEGVLGVDLPDDVIRQVVSGVQAKLAGTKLADAAASLKKLF